MLLVRRIGLVILAIAAIVVYFTLEPSEGAAAPSIPSFRLGAADYGDLLDQVLEDERANAARTDSAPQQQVVNGWVARDLLSILVLEGAQSVEALDVLAEQNELLYDAATKPDQRDDRPTALLVIGVLAIGLWGFTDTRAVSVAGPERARDRSLPVQVPSAPQTTESSETLETPGEGRT